MPLPPVMGQIAAEMSRFKDEVIRLLRRGPEYASHSDVAATLDGQTADEVKEDLLNIVRGHVGVKGENIHGLTPSDVDTYTKAEWDAELASLSSNIDYAPISRYGDLTNLPPSISDSYVGTTLATKTSTYIPGKSYCNAGVFYYNDEVYLVRSRLGVRPVNVVVTKLSNVDNVVSGSDVVESDILRSLDPVSGGPGYIHPTTPSYNVTVVDGVEKFTNISNQFVTTETQLYHTSGDPLDHQSWRADGWSGGYLIDNNTTTVLQLQAVQSNKLGTTGTLNNTTWSAGRISANWYSSLSVQLNLGVNWSAHTVILGNSRRNITVAGSTVDLFTASEMVRIVGGPGTSVSTSQLVSGNHLNVRFLHIDSNRTLGKINLSCQVYHSNSSPSLAKVLGVIYFNVEISLYGDELTPNPVVRVLDWENRPSLTYVNDKYEYRQNGWGKREFENIRHLCDEGTRWDNYYTFVLTDKNTLIAYKTNGELKSETIEILKYDPSLTPRQIFSGAASIPGSRITKRLTSGDTRHLTGNLKHMLFFDNDTLMFKDTVVNEDGEYEERVVAREFKGEFDTKYWLTDINRYILGEPSGRSERLLPRELTPQYNNLLVETELGADSRVSMGVFSSADAPNNIRPAALNSDGTTSGEVYVAQSVVDKIQTFVKTRVHLAHRASYINGHGEIQEFVPTVANRVTIIVPQKFTNLPPLAIIYSTYFLHVSYSSPYHYNQGRWWRYVGVLPLNVTEGDRNNILDAELMVAPNSAPSTWGLCTDSYTYNTTWTVGPGIYDVAEPGSCHINIALQDGRYYISGVQDVRLSGASPSVRSKSFILLHSTNGNNWGFIPFSGWASDAVWGLIGRYEYNHIEFPNNNVLSLVHPTLGPYLGMTSPVDTLGASIVACKINYEAFVSNGEPAPYPQTPYANQPVYTNRQGFYYYSGLLFPTQAEEVVPSNILDEAYKGVRYVIASTSNGLGIITIPKVPILIDGVGGVMPRFTLEISTQTVGKWHMWCVRTEEGFSYVSTKTTTPPVGVLGMLYIGWIEIDSKGVVTHSLEKVTAIFGHRITNSKGGNSIPAPALDGSAKAAWMF